MWRRFSGVLVILLLLAACSGGESSSGGDLPTRVSVDSEDVAAITETQAPIESGGEALPMGETGETQTPTLVPSPTFGRATLPPTWTPTPIVPTPTRQTNEFSASAQSAVETVQNGTIFYIYNGDVIIAQDPETGFYTDLVRTGSPIDALRLSPDEQWLAFVTQNGSAYEVFVTDLSGSGQQRVSCLGYGFIPYIAWHPDSNRLIFAAAPTNNDLLSVYTVTVENAGNCPANDQRLLFELGNIYAVGGLTFDQTGDWVFFSNPLIQGYNMNTGTITPPLTSEAGTSGTYFALSAPPVEGNWLAFIRDTEANTSVAQSGDLVAMDVSNPLTPLVEFEQRLPHTHYAWSRDGEYILQVYDERSIALIGAQNRIGESIFETFIPTDVTFSPTGEQILYIDNTDGPDNYANLYILDFNTGTREQITTFASGWINDMVWSSRLTLR